MAEIDSRRKHGAKKRGGQAENLSNEDILKCPICLDEFDTPRALACLHTFCEPCLKFYVADCKASEKDGKLTKIECPVCKYPTVPPDLKKHPHAVVKDLPLNHFILSYIDSRNADAVNHRHLHDAHGLPKKSVQFSQLCGSCTDRKVSIEAIAYCNDCGEFQCDECVNNHSKNKLLKTHRIVGVDKEADSTRIRISESFKRHNLCRHHQTEEVRYFCVDHDVLLCSSCVFEQHKACEMVNDFEDLGKQLKEDEKPKKMRENMKGLQKLVRDMIDAVRANDYGLKRESEDIPKRIKTMKEKIIRMFYYLEENANTNIHKFQDECHKSNSEKSFKCKQILFAIEGSCAALDTLVENGTPQQLFTTFQTLRQQLQEYDATVQHEKDSLVCTSIQLKIEESLNDIITAIDKLGEVFVVTSKPDLDDLPPLLFAKSVEKAVDRKSEFVKTATFKVTEANVEKECISACFLENMLVLLFGVRKRKWLSFNFTLIDTKNLTEAHTTELKRDPKDIFRIEDFKFAVTFPNNGLIELYTIIPKKRKKQPLTVVLEKTIKCDIRESSITPYNSDEFAVSTGNYIGIMTHDGVMKRMFYYSVSLRERETDFWNTQLSVDHIVVDMKKKRLYVAASKPHRLYSFSLNGDVLFEHNLDAPASCLELDKDGVIFVCIGNGKNGKLCQFSHTGKLLQLGSMEMECPRFVCCNRENRDFYLIESKNNTTRIDKNRIKVDDEDENLFSED